MAVPTTDRAIRGRPCILSHLEVAADVSTAYADIQNRIGSRPFYRFGIAENVQAPRTLKRAPQGDLRGRRSQSGCPTFPFARVFN
jgi:hypothetical protein